MKKLIRFKYIIPAALFAVFGVMGVLLSSQNETYSLIEVLHSSQYEKTVFEESLKQCQKYCPESEAQMSAFYAKILSSYLKGEINREQAFTSWIRIYDETLVYFHKRKHVTHLVRSYQETLQFLNEFEILGYQNLAFQKNLQTQIFNLPKQYPKNSQVYELLGGLQLIENAPYETIIATYKRCLQLDSSNKVCKKFYKRFADFYTQEICVGENLSQDFQFYLGSDKKINNFSDEIEFADDKIYLSQKPILEKTDFAQIKPSDQLNPREGLMLSFNDQGKDKLFEVTHNHIKKRIVVVLNKQVLTAPHIAEGVKQTSVILDFDDRIKNNLDENVFDQICPKTTAKKLPEHLVL